MLYSRILDRSEYDIIQRLDEKEEGQFANIFLVKSKETGDDFIAKCFKLTFEHPDDQKNFFKELEIQAKIEHEAVLPLHQWGMTDFSGEIHPTIITPYMPNLSMKNILMKEYSHMAPENWNSTTKMKCLIGISSAMQYVHSNGIVHRDLKPGNILIDANLHPKVCDFGFSQVLNSIDSFMDDNLGTPLYQAPEMLKQERYTIAVDVYAFGLIAYEIYCGIPPTYKNRSYKHFISLVASGVRPRITISNEDQINLIQRCWANDPNVRPTFVEIFNLLTTNRNLWLPNTNENEIRDYINLLIPPKPTFFEHGFGYVYRGQDLEKVISVLEETKTHLNPKMKRNEFEQTFQEIFNNNYSSSQKTHREAAFAWAQSCLKRTWNYMKGVNREIGFVKYLYENNKTIYLNYRPSRFSGLNVMWNFAFEERQKYKENSPVKNSAWEVDPYEND